MPATRDSVAAGAYCAVDGIGEKIAVDVLDAALPAKLLGALGTDQWQVRNFLDSAGLPETLPEDAAARRQAPTRVTARSDERRVGNACVRTCRSRMSPSHYKQKHTRPQHPQCPTRT